MLLAPGAALAQSSYDATGHMTQARDLHTATVLNNGTILIAGGEDRMHTFSPGTPPRSTIPPPAHSHRHRVRWPRAGRNTPPRGCPTAAWRLGPGSGRIYTLGVSCRDAAGNTSSTNVIVTVPHDQGR